MNVAAPADIRRQRGMARLAWKAMPHTIGRHLDPDGYATPAHVKLVSWALHLTTTGHVRRLAISQPPRTSKSETVDKWGTVHALEHHPQWRNICSSYSGKLAAEQGRAVRNTIEQHADKLTVQIAEDSRARDSWHTTEGGGMWTMGVDGTLTGRGARRLVIDDAHKDHKEALSEIISENVWRWYQSTARTRLAPGGSIVVPMTRWAENDLIGRLATADEPYGRWMFIRLPAIAEETETIETVIGQAWADKLRGQGIRLPEWHREQGQALWPTLRGEPWFDETEMEWTRADVGEMVWAGLYQQRPAPMEGKLFKADDWKPLNHGLPQGAYLYVRRWDLAATEKKGDWTAGVLMAMHVRTRRIYVVDVKNVRYDPDDVEQLVARTAREDRERYGNVLIRLEQEPGASGKIVAAAWLRTVLAGFPARFIPSSGSKEVRAMPFSAQVGAGNVYLCRTSVGEGQWDIPAWWQWLIDQATTFPHGKNDDIIDAASAAYGDLIEELPRRSRARARTAASRRLPV